MGPLPKNRAVIHTQLESIAEKSNFQCIDMFQSIATLRLDMFQSVATIHFDMCQSIATLPIDMFQSIATYQ